MVERNVFDTASLIAAGDDGKSYDNVAIALHWLTALLVLIQFALGQTWGWFVRPTRHLMIVTHMSLVSFSRWSSWHGWSGASFSAPRFFT